MVNGSVLGLPCKPVALEEKVELPCIPPCPPPSPRAQKIWSSDTRHVCRHLCFLPSSKIWLRIPRQGTPREGSSLGMLT